MNLKKSCQMAAGGILVLTSVYSFIQWAQAEMDPNTLNAILSQLAKDDSTSGTTNTATSGSSSNSSGGGSSTTSSASSGSNISTASGASSGMDPNVLNSIFSQLAGNEWTSASNTGNTSSSSTSGGLSSSSTSASSGTSHITSATNSSTVATNNTTSNTSSSHQAAASTSSNTTTTLSPSTAAVSKPTTISTPTIKIARVEIGDHRATFTFWVSGETSDIQKFIISYTDPKGKTEQVTTNTKDSIKNQKGEYVWYIPNLELTKYSVKIAAAKSNGEAIDGVSSKVFEADLSLNSAGKCTIPDVSGINLTFDDTFTTLGWDDVAGAEKYKVYKKNTKGAFVFIEETIKPSYVVNVSGGKVRFEDFSVKAVCQDGAESVNFAPSVRVKTGPAEIAALFLVSFIVGGYVMYRKKRALTSR